MFSSKVFKSAMLVMVWYPFKIWNWEVMLVALLVKNLYVKIFQHIFCLTRSRPNPVSFVCVCMFVYGGRGDRPMSGRFSLVEHGNIINIGFHGFFLLSQGIKRSYAFGIFSGAVLR